MHNIEEMFLDTCDDRAPDCIEDLQSALLSWDMFQRVLRRALEEKLRELEEEYPDE